MRIGESLMVSIEGHPVGVIAQIEDIEDGKATIIIPATRVVMGVKQSLVDIEPEASTEQQLIGTQDTGGDTGSDAVDEAESAEHTPLSQRDLDSSDID